MTSQSNLIEEYRKLDPFLTDPDRLERFLHAHELLRLIRLGHPDEHGEGYGRFQVMRMIEDCGMKIFDDLGWPGDWQSLYVHLRTRDTETLESILKRWGRGGLTPLCRKMRILEEKLEALTSGGLSEPFHMRGLETFPVNELRKFAKEYDSEEFRATLKQAVLMHKAFYERLYRDEYEPPVTLTGDRIRTDLCAANIAKQARWLKIDVEEPVPESEIPPRSYDDQIWGVLERWEPAPNG